MGSLVYRVSARIARDTPRNPVLRNRKQVWKPVKFQLRTYQEVGLPGGCFCCCEAETLIGREQLMISTLHPGKERQETTMDAALTGTTAWTIFHLPSSSGPFCPGKGIAAQQIHSRFK